MNEANETQAADRTKEIREAINWLAYVLAEQDGKHLFYSLGRLLAEENGKSQETFLDEQRAMLDAIARAKAQGLSIWGQLITGLAAVVATSNGTSSDFLDTLAELLTDLNQGVRQGMREAVHAGLWPWAGRPHREAGGSPGWTTFFMTLSLPAASPVTPSSGHTRHA